MGMNLVADIAASALRDKGGDFGMHLGGRFQAAEVGPKILEDDGATMEGDSIATRSELRSENNGSHSGQHR